MKDFTNCSHQVFFRQINSLLSNLFSKTVPFTKVLKKNCVRENSRNFHTMTPRRNEKFCIIWKIFREINSQKCRFHGIVHSSKTLVQKFRKLHTMSTYVETYDFVSSCPSDFTWNQFWLFIKHKGCVIVPTQSSDVMISYKNIEHAQCREIVGSSPGEVI